MRSDVSATDAQIALKLLSLLAGSALNCGVSLLFESPAISSSDSLQQLVQTLVESGQMSLLSNHPTMNEFIESRSILYSHDRARYPMYFDRKVATLPELRILPKASSATRSLSAHLASWGVDREAASDREKDAKWVVSESLRRREGRAITAALFSTAAAHSTRPELTVGVVRRQISIEYTKHFMETLNSDIATGIRGIDFFDRCALQFPRFDIPTLFNLARLLGIRQLVEEDWRLSRSFWEEFFYRKGFYDALALLTNEVEVLCVSLSRMYCSDRKNDLASFRIYINQTLERLNAHHSHEMPALDGQLYLTLRSRLQSVIAHLSHNQGFAKFVETTRAEQEGDRRYRFVLMVATEVEQKSVLEETRLAGNIPMPYFGGERAYYDLGYINGNRIALVKAEMGSSTVGGSITTTMRIVAHLKPSYIIMTGIAFGIDEKKQKMASVLIGRQILAYEQARVGTSKRGDAQLRPRGDRTSADPSLLSLLQTAAGVWDQAPVEAGLLLSGEKLIDNIDFREQIKAISSGDAIGGEMEGSGLMAAAAESRTPWIVVKAICDWANGRKSFKKAERQELAARNSASLVFRALSIPMKLHVDG